MDLDAGFVDQREILIAGKGVLAAGEEKQGNNRRSEECFHNQKRVRLG